MSRLVTRGAQFRVIETFVVKLNHAWHHYDRAFTKR